MSPADVALIGLIGCGLVAVVFAVGRLLAASAEIQALDEALEAHRRELAEEFRANDALRARLVAETQTTTTEEGDA